MWLSLAGIKSRAASSRSGGDGGHYKLYNFSVNKCNMVGGREADVTYIENSC